MSKKSEKQADIAIANASGTEVGMTLVRRNGVPVYTETTIPAQANQIFQGNVSYGANRADIELRRVYDDWRAGFGRQYENSSDLKRYFYGTDIDARFEGEVRAGPLGTAITLDAYPGECADEGFEIWTDGNTLTNWTFTSGVTGDAILYRNTAQKRSGTYCAQITDATGAGETFTLSQTLSWNNNYRNKVINIRVYAYVSAAWATMTIGVYDGVGQTTTVINDLTSYALKTVQHTMDAAATKLEIRFTGLNNAGASRTIYIDDLRCDAPYNGSLANWVEFNGSLYMATGRNLWKGDATLSAFTLVDSFYARITDLYAGTVSGTDYLFICLGWDDAYYYMDTDEAFTESNLTSNTLKYFTVDGVTFRGSDTNSTIVSTIAPLNGGTNWGTSKQMGEDAYDIVDLRMFGGLPYVKKSDCTVWYLDSSAAVQVLVSGKANIAGTNTARMYAWREEVLIIPYGEQGLLHYDGTTITHISPALYINNTSDFVGQVQAVTGDDQWLYVVLDNSTKVEILATREELVDGSTDWRWHPLAELTLTNCASANISSIYKKRLWVGSDTGTESVYHYPIPTTYGDLDSDSDLTYQTGGYFYTPFIHFDLRGDNKAWPVLKLVMGHTYDVDIYFAAAYQLLEDTAWTSIGNFKGASGNMTETKSIPNDSGSNEPQSAMIRFRFSPVTDDTAKTPILLSYEVKSYWYPPQREVIECQILVADTVVQTQGVRDDTLGTTIRTLLDELYNPAKSWPRQFWPLDWASGDSATYIKALPPKKAYPRIAEKGKNIEWVYDCAFLVVPTS